MKISVIASTAENYVAPKEEFDRLSGHAAGVCYMTNNLEQLFNEPEEKTIKRCNNTKTRQHHSVFGHPFVSLSLEDIPKGWQWCLIMKESIIPAKNQQDIPRWC